MSCVKTSIPNELFDHYTFLIYKHDKHCSLRSHLLTHSMLSEKKSGRVTWKHAVAACLDGKGGVSSKERPL